MIQDSFAGVAGAIALCGAVAVRLLMPVAVAILKPGDELQQ